MDDKPVSAFAAKGNVYRAYDDEKLCDSLRSVRLCHKNSGPAYQERPLAGRGRGVVEHEMSYSC